MWQIENLRGVANVGNLFSKSETDPVFAAFNINVANRNHPGFGRRWKSKSTLKIESHGGFAQVEKLR